MKGDVEMFGKLFKNKKKVFEDEFMEVQTDIMGLCVEGAETTNAVVSKIYAYCSIEEGVIVFYAFYDADGEIKTAEELGISEEIEEDMFLVGGQDLMRLMDVCDRHNMPMPTEIRMYYDNVTGKFQAEYQYDPVCINGVSPDDVFESWINEIKAAK